MAHIEENDGWVFCGNTGWDVSAHPQNVIHRFFDNIGIVDWHTNITSNFHESINDTQIQRITNYFKLFKGHWIKRDAHYKDHFEFQGYLFFDNQLQSESIEVFCSIGVEYDDFWSHFKIVGIRIINQNTYGLVRTIYAARNAKTRYNRNTAKYGTPNPLKADFPTV